MSKTVEIRIPKEKRIIVCTEGSLENKLYQLGIEQGKLAEREKKNEDYLRSQAEFKKFVERISKLPPLMCQNCRIKVVEELSK